MEWVENNVPPEKFLSTKCNYHWLRDKHQLFYKIMSWFYVCPETTALRHREEM